MYANIISKHTLCKRMNRRRRKNLHITCLINNTDSWIRIKATKFIDDPCKVTFLCSMKLCENQIFTIFEFSEVTKYRFFQIQNLKATQKWNVIARKPRVGSKKICYKILVIIINKNSKKDNSTLHQA